MVDLRFIPQHLHRRVCLAGALHLELPVRLGLELVAAMRCNLPGMQRCGMFKRYVQKLPAEADQRVLA